MRRLAFICACVALLSSAACTSITDTGIDRPDLSSVHPDKVLYERGLDALNHEKCAVAYLTFQTLANTYPKSEYAVPAKAITEQRSCDVHGSSLYPDNSVFFSMSSN
jgi:outer membrane protein assembly factor BamD (BamD/ComL family)